MEIVPLETVAIAIRWRASTVGQYETMAEILTVEAVHWATMILGHVASIAAAETKKK